MVWRSPVLILGALCALCLGSCTSAPPAATPVAASSRTTPVAVASSPAPVAFTDGDYLLIVEPTTCSSPMNGHVLTVSSGTATLPLDGVTKTGPVAVNETTVSIELNGGNGGLQLLLDGVLAADGTVTGPGKETAGPGSGYDCAFTFTLSPPASEAATLPDGDYVMHVQPDCPTVMEGRTVTIASGTASYLMESEYTMTGTITTDHAAVTVQLDLTSPSRISTTLDGTLWANAVVVGTGRNGGIHPGGETGYTCDFTFVMAPAPPAPPKPAAAAGVDCSRDTGSQTTGLFHLDDGRWVRKDRAAECAAGSIPADIADLACNSN